MKFRSLWPVYVLTLGIALVVTYLGNEVVTTMAQGGAASGRTCVVIDAGHGGIDGGATSCSGVLESQLNLQIAGRLDAMIRLLGYETKMTRTTDTSIHTEGHTIAAQKVSDLKNRVSLVNTDEVDFLISIHQNIYTDPRYGGTQVFYAQTPHSMELAKQLQKDCIQYLDRSNKRSCKQASGVYLMEHVDKTAVLIECGFLSNPEDDRKLNDPKYQKDLAAVIAGSVVLTMERGTVSE